MEIILVRHAQSEGNAQGLYSGITDDNLTDLGKKQADQVAKYLAATLTKVEKVYSSPLVRAFDTAKLISKYLLLAEPELDNRLAEIDLGVWEGQPAQALEASNSDLIEKWKEDPFEVEVPGAEKVNSVKSRIFEFCEEVSKMGLSRIVVVSHATVIHSLLIPLLGREGKEFWSIRIDNAGISIIEWDSHPQVISINQTEHLREA